MSGPPPDWPNRAHSRFVRSAGVEWHVQELGEGPVMLLLHGTGASTHSWAPLMPLLAQHFTVMALDFPGHAFTTGRPAGGLSVSAIATGVATLMAAQDRVPLIIVGHSAGVAVAIRLASAGLHPKAIVGIGAALLPFPGVARRLFPALAKMLFVNPLAPLIVTQLANRPGAVADVLPRLTGSHISDEGVAHYERLFRRANHVGGTIGMMAAWDLEPVKVALPHLGVPLLLIHGEDDKTIPVAAAREAAALVPGATLDVMPGLGHLLHEEASRATSDRIVAFARTLGIVSD